MIALATLTEAYRKTSSNEPQKPIFPYRIDELWLRFLK